MDSGYDVITAGYAVCNFDSRTLIAQAGDGIPARLAKVQYKLQQPSAGAPASRTMWPQPRGFSTAVSRHVMLVASRSQTAIVTWAAPYSYAYLVAGPGIGMDCQRERTF